MSLSNKPTLKIDWATHDSARYACENWHYSKKIPVNKLLKIGVWEDGNFIGVIIFGVGASAVLHKQFNLTRFEVCELVRVALKEHRSSVSRMIAIALKFLKKSNPKIKICVSFADPVQGHAGKIYQAGNWIYTGISAKTREYFFNNDWRHVTDVYKRLSPEAVKKLRFREKPGKFRYVMPLDDDMRNKVKLLNKPYPKCVSSADSGTLGSQPRRGGAIPTDTLQFQNAK